MTIFLKKFGTTLSGRQFGKEAFSAFLPSLKEVKGNEKVEEQWIYDAKAGHRSHYVYFANGIVVNTQVVGENIKE